jgi:hypothetical protein
VAGGSPLVSGEFGGDAKEEGAPLPIFSKRELVYTQKFTDRAHIDPENGNSMYLRWDNNIAYIHTVYPLKK